MTTIFCIIQQASQLSIDSQESFDLAIDLWKGKEISGNDCYTEAPLLLCLGTTWTPDQRIEILLERTGYDGVQVAKKAMHHLKHIIGSNPISHANVNVSMSLLVILQSSKFLSLSAAVKKEAPSVLSSSLARLANDINYRLRKTSLRASLEYLNSYFLERPFNVKVIMMHGFLYNILESASLHPGNGEEDMLSSCLKNLLPSLVYYDALRSVPGGFDDLLKEGHNLSKLLSKTHADFRSTWKIFQAVLVEQLLLSRVFEKGYGREQGGCANQSCVRLGDRRDFKKCAGCGFTLYCSEDCQNQNWSRHRRDCKKVEKGDGMEYNENINQFPRRVATVQINRFWSDILSLAKKNNIPEETLGVRVDYCEYPFEIEVFNYRPFASTNPNNIVTIDEVGTDSVSLFSNPAYFPMVAKEALRRSQEGQRCVVLVVALFDGRELPSVAYIEDATSPLPAMEQAKIPPIESHYVDGLGNRLRSREDDTLGRALRLAQPRLLKDADAFWSHKEFHGIADEVYNA